MAIVEAKSEDNLRDINMGSIFAVRLNGFNFVSEETAKGRELLFGSGCQSTLLIVDDSRTSVKISFLKIRKFCFFLFDELLIQPQFLDLSEKYLFWKFFKIAIELIMDDRSQFFLALQLLQTLLPA